MNIKDKKNLVLVATLVAIVLVTMIVKICGKDSLEKSIKIIEKDLGETIEVSKAYYSEKLNYYFLVFEYGDEEDIACVKIDDKEVGYASVYYGEKSRYEGYKEYMSREQLQQMTRDKLDYPYDAVCEMNIKYGMGDWKEIEISRY